MSDVVRFSHLGIGELFEVRGELYAKTDTWVKVRCNVDGSFRGSKERVFFDFDVERVGKYLRDTTSG